jgi:hypothetical protein
LHCTTSRTPSRIAARYDEILDIVEAASLSVVLPDEDDAAPTDGIVRSAK